MVSPNTVRPLVFQVVAVVLVTLLAVVVTAHSLDSLPRYASSRVTETRALDLARHKIADNEETLKSDSSYGIGFYPGYYGYGYGYPYYGYGYGYGYPFYGYGHRLYGNGLYGYGYPYWW